MTDRELQMTEQTQDLISPKLALAIANPIFPQLDSQLRIGKHINIEQLDEHAFLMDFQAELEQFYRRYHVELIRAPEGFFYQDEVYEELLNLADEAKLLKAVNPRSTGSDLDRAKLVEKVGGALRRLARIGIITRVGEQNSKKFIIAESVFRFGADVRSGDDPREAQLRLIREGEATTPALLAEQNVDLMKESDNPDEIEENEE